MVDKDYNIDINSEDKFEINIEDTTYTLEINPTDTFEIQLNEQGPKGNTGNGISRIEIIEQTIDYTTYRIYYTNESYGYYDYTVRNGINCLNQVSISSNDWVTVDNKYRYTYNSQDIILDCYSGTYDNREKVDVDIQIVDGISYIYSLNPFDGFLLSSAVRDPIDTQEYVHTQAIPSTEWIIEHNLNCHPSVTITNYDGEVVDGECQYVNNNKLILNFKAGFSGKAYLNYTR
jgi:hypothetical protein